jgi:hypothetical protein
MDTLNYILNKYNLNKDIPQHKLYRSRWGSLSVLFKELGFNIGAEIGVETGRYSKCLCTINPNLKLFSIDAWEEPDNKIYDKAKKRLTPFNCQIIRDRSMNAVKMSADESLDFVFIDAAHDYDSAKEDIEHWSKKVKKGGIVSGHDYNNGLRGQPRGVKGAVNEWVEKNNIQPLFIFNKDGCPTWFYVKEKNDLEEVTKGIIYYTDNRLDEKIMAMCQEQLKKVHLPITSVSLAPIDFGENIVYPGERGYLTMAKQILTGLEDMTVDVVFFAEHDVLYHPSHFDFTPLKKGVYYYNTNSWMLRIDDGHGLYYFHRSLSGICAYRETLIKHYKERIKKIEALILESGNTGMVKSTENDENEVPLKEGIHRLGFEPGTHSRPERIDYLPAENYRSQFPNLDIKHKHNLTKNRWTIDQFRDKSVAKTWKEVENYQIEGWEGYKYDKTNILGR